MHHWRANASVGCRDWFPAGSRAAPLREIEGSALESEAQPSEQDALGQAIASGEYRQKKKWSKNVQHHIRKLPSGIESRGK